MSSTNKCIEGLQTFKQAKKFLDLLAISAGRKQPRLPKKNRSSKNQPSSNTDLLGKPTKDETFITTGENVTASRAN
jgi:hypothetical protein